ncbi:Ubiquitin-conjugating BIR-domain enzyme [Pelomyxa schiedti]|nr:Ubiquitin-conjugating BIR-domain enzyme [Pelomyxa schiedti]
MSDSDDSFEPDFPEDEAPPSATAATTTTTSPSEDGIVKFIWDGCEYRCPVYMQQGCAAGASTWDQIEVSYRTQLVELQKKTKSFAKKSERDEDDSPRIAGEEPEHGGWAKGTGYGSDYSSENSRFDMNAYLAAKKEEDELAETFLTKLISAFDQPDEVPYNMIERTSMLSILYSYLMNDSLLDMSMHPGLYASLFQICQILASREELFPLLFCATQTQKPLFSLLKKQNDIATKTMKLAHNTTEDEGDAAITKIMKGITESYESAYARLASLTGTPVSKPKTSTDTTTDTASSSASTTTTTSTTTSSSTTSSESQGGDWIDPSFYNSQLEPFMFDMTTMEISSHHYNSEIQSSGSASKIKALRIAQEQATLATCLPINSDSSIFVRVDSDHMDVLRALITGPMASDYGRDSTPYAGGAFMFDIFIPSNYPSGPPHVNLQTTGGGTVRFNPNLYECGKVCLSLLGTWDGDEGENWNSETSTLLQVLISIQSLIFIPQPYFNEPGYESEMGTSNGDQNSRNYNERIREGTLKHAILGQLQHPSPGFEDVIKMHFYMEQHRIVEQVRRWIQEANKFNNSSHASRLQSDLDTLTPLLKALSYPYGTLKP